MNMIKEESTESYFLFITGMSAQIHYEMDQHGDGS